MDEPASPPIPVAELPHLPTFLQAAERGSFTAAARALGITQAAVSQRIAALERELRAPLFERRAGRIALTAAGRRLHELSRQILELHLQARQELGDAVPMASGALRIASSSVPGECHLPARLAEFRQRYPWVQVSVQVLDSDAVIAGVERGRSAFGIVGKRAEQPSLVSEPVGTDFLVLVVPSDHPWAESGRATLESLVQAPLLLREPGSGSRCALKASLDRSGIPLHALNVAIELGSNAAIKDAVLQGLGVAFLSRSVVHRELESGALRSIAIPGLDLSRKLYAIHDRRRPLDVLASSFLSFLKTHPLEPEPEPEKTAHKPG